MGADDGCLPQLAMGEDGTKPPEIAAAAFCDVGRQQISNNWTSIEVGNGFVFPNLNDCAASRNRLQDGAKNYAAEQALYKIINKVKKVY
ncbi:MAG: hypothetical protein ACOX12_01425 [Eggerthellaceae bacterium]|jgi:hypothetical protein